MKEVWIVTANPFESGWEIMGVFADESSANDYVNDGLFLDYLGGRTATDELVNRFYEEIKPEVVKHKVW